MSNKKVVSLRLDENTVEEIKIYAAQKRITSQEYMRLAILKALDSDKKGDDYMTSAVITKKSFGQILLEAAVKNSWDIYNVPFKPGDLKIDASKFGSFSDYCLFNTTTSANQRRYQCLKPVEFKEISGEKVPEKYLFISNQVRVFNALEDVLSRKYSELKRYARTPGFSFEIIGFMDEPDLSFVCCHSYPTIDDAVKAADLFQENEYKLQPIGDSLTGEVQQVFIEDVAIKTRQVITIVNGQCGISGPGRVAQAGDSPYPSRSNLKLVGPFEVAIKEVLQRLGRK